MNHPTRAQLAHDLVHRMAKTYPLLIGGVYGSTARGEDTEWSDLELWFIVQDGCDAQGRHIIFRDMADWDFSCLPLVDEVVAGFWALVVAEGIEVMNYTDVGQVPL